MSFKEVLEIVPKLSSTELNNMEKNLGSRFANVAKKFGKGLTEVLTGGSILAAGAALVQRLLNPLKEIQEAVDKTLSKGQDIKAHATQFGSTTGELAKLQALGQAKGVDAGALNLLIEKFQSAVTTAKFNPGEHSAVRNYVGQTDSVKGFFDFIQNLQKLDLNKQVQVQEEVFGQRQTLKMSEFLHSDFDELTKRFASISTGQLDKAGNKLGNLADKDEANKAFRNLQDFLTKGKVIGAGVINARDQADVNQKNKENDQIKDYANLSMINDKMENIMHQIEKLTTEVFTQLPILFTAMDTVVDLLKQSVQGWKMIFNWLKSFRGLRMLGIGGKDDK